MPEVRLENIRKSFGKNQILNGINLDVNNGEFLVLLGPSGSGKTTTLRIIAGLEIQDSGHVYIGDKLVDSMAPKDRDVAMVFQNYALYPHKTVAENIAMPLIAKKEKASVIEEKVEEIAKRLDISELLERYPRQLSGGQQQRVALARALVKEPEVFLMDEPLSNLDAKLRVSARTFLKALQKKLGITTIYVTHDQAEAMAMADRVALISDGLVQQLAPPEELYFRPVNEFVAGFLGSPSINMIDGESVESGSTLKLLGSELKIPHKISEGKVKIGIRPEDISISKEKGLVKAQVFVVEPLGSETLVTLETSDGTRVVAKVLGDLKIKENETVWISINEAKILVFKDGYSVWPQARSSLDRAKPQSLDYVFL
ncbi:MAG: ABC transporter ATP-binding protein [Thermoprotei archaeon]